MKHGTTTAMVALLLASAVACTPPAAPPKPTAAPAVNGESAAREVYDLEERCGRTAREWFKQEWGDGHSNSGGIDLTGIFENHYNSVLHKCYVLLTSVAISKDAQTRKYTHSETKMLLDINEHRTEGEYDHYDGQYGSTCTMSGKTCQSGTEWDAWAKQYMER
jgi:hypothetical protein